MGHVVSKEGVSTDPGKVSTAAEWRRPSNVAELRSFLGFASYYQRFVEGFVKLAAPLHCLVAELVSTKKRRGTGRPMESCWTPECEQELITAPVLAYADFSKPFVLDIDASHSGLGAVLSQEVAYASRGLRPTEKNMKNYSSTRSWSFLPLNWLWQRSSRTTSWVIIAQSIWIITIHLAT